MEKYIVRGVNSGLFYGEIKSRNGVETVMTNARNIYYWDGAARIEELSLTGTKKPQNCKFTVTIDELIVADTCQICKCTKTAIENLDGVKEWKF